MTWTLVGKIRTEPLDGGETTERVCGACGQDATFAEHDSARGRVMVCGECGVAFKSATASEGPSTIDDAVDRATDAAVPLWERAAEAAKDAIGRASEGIGPLAKKAGEAFERIADNTKAIVSAGGAEKEAEDEDPEKADLLRRFAELEKKMKDRRGD